jgi:hypothetical protein
MPSEPIDDNFDEEQFDENTPESPSSGDGEPN